MIRRASLAAVALTGILAVAGCASPAAEPAPTHASKPAEHAATPTPTATVALPSPGWPYAIGCEGILPTATVQSHIVAPISLKYDEHSVPSRASDVAMADAGALTCVWGGTDRTDSSYDDGLTLTVLPDAATEFASWKASSGASSGGGSICSVNPCGDDRLVGTTWFSLRLSDSRRAGGSGANLSADDSALAALITTALGNLGPRSAAWTPPASAENGRRFCDPAEAAVLAGVMGIEATRITQRSGSEYVDLGTVAVNRGGLQECSWDIGPQSDSGGVSIATVPGGAWALPRMLAAPQSHYPLGSMSAIRVSGTDGAVAGCGDGCEALFSFGGSLVSLSISPPSEGSALPTFEPQLERFIASLTT